MQTINKLLDIAKDKKGLKSDRELARALGRTSIHQYKTKGVIPEDDTAIRLAELCDMKPEMVISICHAAKAKTPEEKNIWKHFYKMAAAAAIGGLVVSGGVSVLPQNVSTSESVAMTQTQKGNGSAMDIMSSIASLLLLLFSKNQRMVY